MFDKPRKVRGNIGLYAPELSEYEIHKWALERQDSEVLYWTGRPGSLTTVSSVREYIEEKAKDDSVRLFPIGLVDSVTFIGVANLEYVTRYPNNVELGIMLFSEYRDKGYGTEVIKLLVDFAFNEMYAHRIRLTADAGNARALKVYENAGFSVCGIEHDVVYYEGEFHDTVIMEYLYSQYLSKKEATQ